MNKDVLIFLNRQISQIRQGGTKVLLLKLKKFLFSPFLYMLTSLAVYFKADWPLAYLWEMKKLNRKYSKIQGQSNPDALAIKNIRRQLISSYKKYISYKPLLESLSDWLEANRGLADFLWDTGEVEESNKVSQFALEVQSNMVKEHQLDRLGIAFMPNFIAYGSIGNYALLQGYIKAGILGLAPQNEKYTNT